MDKFNKIPKCVLFDFQNHVIKNYEYFKDHLDICFMLETENYQIPIRSINDLDELKNLVIK